MTSVDRRSPDIGCVAPLSDMASYDEAHHTGFSGSALWELGIRLLLMSAI